MPDYFLSDGLYKVYAMGFDILYHHTFPKISHKLLVLLKLQDLTGRSSFNNNLLNLCNSNAKWCDSGMGAPLQFTEELAAKWSYAFTLRFRLDKGPNFIVLLRVTKCVV